MHRPRLRTILLVGNLVLLAVPLAGIWLLRIYESALIRQTESELIAQAAVLGAAYRQAWLASAEPGTLERQPQVDPAQARTMRGILAPNAREPLFARDLAVDSLALMNIVMELEDRFDLSIPLDRLATVQTVGDLSDLINTLRMKA